MADDIDLWALGNDGMLGSLDASYRLGAATGANAGDAFPASLLVYKQANGHFYCGGRLGINRTDPPTWLSIAAAASNPSLTAVDGPIELKFDVTTVLAIGGMSGAPYALWLQGKQDNAGYSGLAFPIAINPLGGNVLTGGVFLPISDNALNIGSGTARFATIYAATGAINTSDAREKTWRGAPTAAELAAARRIVAELGFYQWNDAIAEKGPAEARYHFGVRAQAVWAIMADEGLIPPIAEGVTPSSPYAFLCYDEWAAVEPIEEARDAEGQVVVMGREARDAGDRFGIRPDQLTLFLLAAQEARLAVLEAAA